MGASNLFFKEKVNTSTFRKTSCGYAVFFSKMQLQNFFVDTHAKIFRNLLCLRDNANYELFSTFLSVQFFYHRLLEIFSKCATFGLLSFFDVLCSWIIIILRLQNLKKYHRLEAQNIEDSKIGKRLQI